MIVPDGVPGELRAGFTNLVAVVGVAVLGWSAGALLVVYWVEAGVALVRGIVQGPFAKREPEDLTPEEETTSMYLPLSSWDDKRGGVSIGPLPRVYPRNLSRVLSSAIVLLIFWPIAGAIVIATVGAGFPIGTVLLAVVGVVAGHVVSLVNYFRDDRYAENTVGSAMARRYVIGILVLGVGGVFVVSRASPPAVLLLIIAIGKLLADLAIARAEASNDSLTGWAEESLDERVPAEEPTAVFKTNRRDLLLRTAGIGPFFMLIPPYLLFALAAILAGLFGGLVAGVAALVLAIVTTILGLVVRFDVERGHLEYHVYPDRIVAYDRLLEAPQWSIDRSNIEEVLIKPSRLDRIRPGSKTIVVSTYGDDHRLRALKRPDEFVHAPSTADGNTASSPSVDERWQ